MPYRFEVQESKCRICGGRISAEYIAQRIAKPNTCSDVCAYEYSFRDSAEKDGDTT